MASVTTSADTQQPAGYLLLQQRYAISGLPHHVESFVSQGTRRTHFTPEKTQETYPRIYWPGESDFDRIEFAQDRWVMSPSADYPS